MGYREIILKLPTDYTDGQLKQAIANKLGIGRFSYQIDRKSLDARKKTDIHWQVKAAVSSDELKGGSPASAPELEIPRLKTDKRVVVVGSGPAGFFAAAVLQLAGFDTTILERGTDVKKRTRGIRHFEATATFDPQSNYAFGEGGAGTFSDGKLTSRTKRISAAKRFIISRYIKAGAPPEIGYMAHPHLGSDHLKAIVKNLRNEFISSGGKILFETPLLDLKIKTGRVKAAVIPAGSVDADYFVIAPGHSAFETYRMLLKRGVRFRSKNFAIGCRVEHPQELINRAQWGYKHLPGVKAAEYRLTANKAGPLPVYTFCMCPGGKVVPSTAYAHVNTVNGMSQYRRNGKFANAACVAGIDLNRLSGKEMDPLEALDWLEHLEERFFQVSGGFSAPFCSIRNFIDRKPPAMTVPESSYPLGLKPAPLWELLPAQVSESIREALKMFDAKIKGFTSGNMMGLESKTSAPIQVLREKSGRCAGFANLHLVGEGSGYAGGIISSGADGISTALKIIEANQ